MKQCPKCSRTYANDKQKFCTKDGTALVDALDASAGQGETVRIDSAQLDDEITKVISQPLPQMSGGVFDPYKTNIATPQPPPDQPATPAEPTPPPSVATPPPSVATPPPSVATPPPTIATPPPAAATPPPVRPAPEPPPATPPPPVTIAATLPPEKLPSMPATPAAAQPAAPVAAKKRSKLPIILGILLVLLFLGAGGLAAGYFFVLKPMLEKKRVVVAEPRRPEPTPAVVSTPDIGSTKPETPNVEVLPYSPPADAVQFVNSSAKLDGKLAEHYVDFSFYYPERWQKDPSSGPTNFVQVERRLPPNYTQENFAVGWYESAGSAEADQAAFPRLAQNLSAKFEKSIDKYQKVSEGKTKVGPYDAYEFRFQGQSQQTDKGQFKIWGVSVFVPPVDGSKNGVTLLMLATSLAPELKSINDVGVKGELPMLLESFRFGK